MAKMAPAKMLTTTTTTTTKKAATRAGARLVSFAVRLGDDL